MERIGMLIWGIWWLAGCHQGSDAAAPEVRARSQQAFAQCSIDCTFDFRTLERERVDVVQSYCGPGKPECISFFGRLTPFAKRELDKLRGQLAQARFDSYGCGGCVDGNDYEVIAETQNGSGYRYGTRFDHNLPAAGRRAHAAFEQVQLAMLTCKPNAWVVMDRDCVAHDEVQPQPYRRP